MTIFGLEPLVNAVFLLQTRFEILKRSLQRSDDEICNSFSESMLTNLLKFFIFKTQVSPGRQMDCIVTNGSRFSL